MDQSKPRGLGMTVSPPKKIENAIPVIGAVVAVSIVGAGAILAVLWLRPKEDNTTLIASILGFLGPTTAALLALLKANQTGAAVQQLHLEVDGRLTQLLEQTAKASKSQGREEIIAENIVASNVPTSGEGV